MPLPSYPEIRLALVESGAVERRLERVRPDAIHVATEGPIGHAMRRLCIRRGLPFTTSFHTRFPDYLAERLPMPARWTSELTWAYLRRFHGAGAAVLAATPTLVSRARNAAASRTSSCGRAASMRNLFRPRGRRLLDLPRPIFLTVGRVAVEKNLEAFLSLDLPGTKVVVGDGPARAALEKAYPDAVFLGARHGEALAETYAAADVFVFPSRTDTFGLVLLEALASGVPVAAFPAPAPRDVLGGAPVGVLDEDLRRPVSARWTFRAQACRDFALTMTWEQSARLFVQHVADAAKGAHIAEAAAAVAA